MESTKQDQSKYSYTKQQKKTASSIRKSKIQNLTKNNNINKNNIDISNQNNNNNNFNKEYILSEINT